VAKGGLKVSDIDLGWNEILDNVTRSDKEYSHAAVGIIGGGDILQIAVWNEMGTKNIPERPFIRQPYDKHLKGIKKLARFLADQVLIGNMTKRNALEALGDDFRNKVRNAIEGREYKINAPATIKRKNRTAREGEGNPIPLIDTGRMVQSIKVEVRK
jgi:hypothetical protein